MRTVLSLNPNEAREFFLKEESYHNFDLPAYFRFGQLLEVVSRELSGKNASNFFLSGKRPEDFEEVNYQLIGNKDGRYAWRPFQLIHPVLYVQLVDVITQKDNWAYIVKRLKSLISASRNINCVSMPAITRRYKKDRAEQISRWSTQVEKESIIYGLEYDYLFHSDITDCYSSLYTHSVPWALHEKSIAKLKIRDLSLVGNKIDKCLQSMANGQTNGIPQGSALMDFIAEIVLCYVDKLLSEKINELGLTRTQYKIIRYRDDYRIFSNNPQIAERIIKELTDILYGFGLKINSGKTVGSADVVHSSLKPDKLQVMIDRKGDGNLTDDLYFISVFSKSFPNSGQLDIFLKNFFNRIVNFSKKDIKENVKVLVSIVVDIAYKNPRVYSTASAILSKLLSFLSRRDEQSVVNKILKKFEKVPNTGIMQLWLQRITLKTECGDYKYTEKLCQKVIDKSFVIWNSDWLNKKMKKKIDSFDLVDREEVKVLSPIVTKEEVELFGLQEYP